MYTGRVQIQINGTFWEFLQVVVPSGRGFLVFYFAYCPVNPLALLFWRDKTPGTPLFDDFKLVDGWRIMPCTKTSVPLLILDSPGTMGTLPPSRIAMAKLSEPFIAAMPDTQMQSLCHRYDCVTPCAVRELECGTSYSHGEWSVGRH